MGNCVGVLKEFHQSSSSTTSDPMMIDHDDDDRVKVKVMMSSGGVMEFYAPITVSSIIEEFPGHALFRRNPNSDVIIPNPLLHDERLNSGELYYLLHRDITDVIYNNNNNPCKTPQNISYRVSSCEDDDSGQEGKKKKKKNLITRMMTKLMKKKKKGNLDIWKVKLAISPEQLSEVMSQNSSLEALIGSVRMVANVISQSMF
ncbi:hypothetical protein G4B88_023514 [Cannabis sativa]|uniref:Uncharacterized protein n=1 Tax=Cannabis sativa TaxID=3483 RepID=A0A7J6HX00_CANSA|nr:hypothetical protein G4B88_023514 [Cannabis sativa]